MPVHRILGIDPGKSGAIVSFQSEDIEVCRLDWTEAEINDWIYHRRTYAFAWLERVSAMPRQGVSSTFKFGTNYGFLRGLLTALLIPFECISPGVWQRNLGCLSRGDKNVTKAKAEQLFPHVKCTHRTADALLIAEYGRRVLVERGILVKM